MYVYLYDNFVKGRKYNRIIQSMETRLTDFGIAGKIIRLQNFSNTKAIVEDEIYKGATTIIIVGNDMTCGQVLSRAAECDIPFGFLPIGADNSIAKVLGIPLGEDAVEVLARRRKVKLDLGVCNDRYFVSSLSIEPSNITVNYDNTFSVSGRDAKIELIVCNLAPFIIKGKNVYTIHPQDGKLEAFLRPVVGKGIFKEIYEEPSIFPFEKMSVTSDHAFKVVADHNVSKEKRLSISLAKEKLTMIVGKERMF